MPQRPGAAATRSQRADVPCLSFPSLQYNGPFTPNCLIWGKSKALLLGPWERGGEGALGAGPPVGWEAAPLPNYNRAARHDGGETGQNPEGPSRSPILPGAAAPPPRPPAPGGTGGFGGPTPGSKPPGRGCQPLSCRCPRPRGAALLPPPLPRRRRSVAGEAGGSAAEWRRRRERMQALEGSRDD